MNKGLLVVISSPSGGGKTSVIKALKKRVDIDFKYSISATTRKPRPGEMNGKDYIFLNENEFQKQANNGELLEWEQVYNYFYGTPAAPIRKWLDAGNVVLLDIDVNGALQIKEKFKAQSISIFLEPPSVDELLQRLKNRNTDSEQEIQKRLQRVSMEMSKREQFDYIVLNDDLNKAIQNVIEIIQNHLNLMED